MFCGFSVQSWQGLSHQIQQWLVSGDVQHYMTTKWWCSCTHVSILPCPILLGVVGSHGHSLQLLTETWWSVEMPCATDPSSPFTAAFVFAQILCGLRLSAALVQNTNASTIRWSSSPSTHLTRHTPMYTGVSGICAPMQNSECTLSTHKLSPAVLLHLSTPWGAIGEMVLPPISQLAPWVHPESVSISASRLAPVYDRFWGSPSQLKWQLDWSRFIPAARALPAQALQNKPSTLSLSHMALYRPQVVTTCHRCSHTTVPNTKRITKHSCTSEHPQTAKRLHIDNQRDSVCFVGELYLPPLLKPTLLVIWLISRTCADSLWVWDPCSRHLQHSALLASDITLQQVPSGILLGLNASKARRSRPTQWIGSTQTIYGRRSSRCRRWNVFSWRFAIGRASESLLLKFGYYQIVKAMTLRRPNHGQQSRWFSSDFDFSFWGNTFGQRKRLVVTLKSSFANQFCSTASCFRYSHIGSLVHALMLCISECMPDR